MNQNQSTLTEIQKHLLNNPGDVQGWLELIKNLIDEGNYTKAEQALYSATAMGAQSPWIKAFRALLMLKQGNHDAAIALLEDIREIAESKDLSEWRNEWLAEAYLETGQLHKASLTINNNTHSFPNQEMEASLKARLQDYSDEHTDINPVKLEDCNPSAIAFYLPQFHPFVENDTWWGPGFTEWTNISDAKPCFLNHNQPRRPGALGFYDLRLKEIQIQQGRLARKYGIDAFCFYFYWFSGKELMHEPLDILLNNRDIHNQFCLCWANESWSRRWDGSESDILIEQKYLEEDPEAFANRVSTFFKDKRYYTVNDKPLLLVYRPDQISDITGTLQKWRNIFSSEGFNEVHISACLTFGYKSEQALSDGFDSGTEFHPHNSVASELSKEKLGAKKFDGKIYSYKEVVSNSIKLLSKSSLKNTHPCVMLEWDNTPRRGSKGNVFIDFDYDYYCAWILVNRIKTHLSNPGQALIFINAWNEWCEGTYLEPDRANGIKSIETTYLGLRRTDHIPAIVTAIRLTSPYYENVRRCLCLSLGSALEKYSKATREYALATGLGSKQSMFMASKNTSAMYYHETADFIACIENCISNDSIPVSSLTGWLATKELSKLDASIRIGESDIDNDQELMASLDIIGDRPDVEQYLQDQGKDFGFCKDWKVDLRHLDVPDGKAIQAIIIVDKNFSCIGRLSTNLIPFVPDQSSISDQSTLEYALQKIDHSSNIVRAAEASNWQEMSDTDKLVLYNSLDTIVESYETIEELLK